MMTQNNVLYVFVAKKSQSGLPTGNAADMAEGDVGVAKLDGTLVTTLIAGPTLVRIVQKTGGVLQYSPEFKFGDIISKSASTYTADSQFVGYLGYNGISGDLTVDVDTVYTPKLVVKGTIDTFANKNMMKEIVYKSPKTAPAYKDALAAGIADAFEKAMTKEPEKYVSTGVVCSDAGAATTLTATTAGSKIAVVDSGTAVGDWIKTSDDLVYKIVALNSATEAVLDRAVIATNAAGTPTLIVKATAQNASTQWGIKFMGQARTNFSPGLFKHMVYNFDILQGANLEDVQVTQTEAHLGTCTNEGVAEEQWFAQGNRGYGNRVDAIPVPSQVTAEMTGADYNGLYIKTSRAQFSSVVGQAPASLVENKVYAAAAVITALKTVFGV